MTCARPPVSLLLRRLLANEDGGSLVEVAAVVPVLAFLLIGTIDLGRGYYAAIEVNDAAEAGAVYGARHLTDTAGMVQAAQLDASDLNGGLTATAAMGCECPDGTYRVPGCSAPPASCATASVGYVQVNTNWTYRPLFPYPGIPSSYNLQGLATLRAGR